MRPQQSGVALRICSVAYREAIALARRVDALEGVRELGFEAFLLPSDVWAACSAASSSDPGSISFTDLGDLATQLGSSRLGVFLDVDLGALPAGHALVQAHPQPLRSVRRVRCCRRSIRADEPGRVVRRV
jgi:hypothetical protein